MNARSRIGIYGAATSLQSFAVAGWHKPPLHGTALPLSSFGHGVVSLHTCVQTWIVPNGRQFIAVQSCSLLHLS